jgi:hypothetical protein
MQTTARFSASGQRDIQRLFRQARFKRCFTDGLTTFIQCIFNGCLGDVNCRTSGFFLFRRQFAQAFEKFSNLTALAEETGFNLLQCIRVRNGSERRLGFAND